MAISRFYGEQHERHKGLLHWPGVNGYPFRGAALPLLKPNELANVPLTIDAYAQSFDLAVKEEAEYYAWVRDRIRNGWFHREWIDRWIDPANPKRVVINMEWSQVYAEAPPVKKTGTPINGDIFTLRST
jgi:hypothetical protein